MKSEPASTHLAESTQALRVSYTDPLPSTPVSQAPVLEPELSTTSESSQSVHLVLPPSLYDEDPEPPPHRKWRAGHEPTVEVLSNGDSRVTHPGCPPSIYTGLMAEAWKDQPGEGVLCAFNPVSWHHPQGVKRILRRLWPRVPSIGNSLHVTLTFDRNRFADPATAHNKERDKIRKIMDEFRKGKSWRGKLYKFDAKYCTKVEFHQDGWAHYHLIILTTEHVPFELFNELWGNGECNVQRIKQTGFWNLLHYALKSCGNYPAWVLEQKQMHIFHSSPGFLIPAKAKVKSAIEEGLRELGEIIKAKKTHRKRRDSPTIGERLKRWASLGLYQEGGLYKTIQLIRPFWEIFHELVLSIARLARYLGSGFIKINQRSELQPWTSDTSQKRP